MVTTSLYAEYFVFRGPMFTCSMSHDMKDTQRMPSAHIPSTKYGFSGVRLVAYLRCDADFFPPVTLCPETCGCPVGDCISSVSSLRLRAKAFSLFSVSVTSSDDHVIDKTGGSDPMYPEASNCTNAVPFLSAGSPLRSLRPPFSHRCHESRDGEDDDDVRPLWPSCSPRSPGLRPSSSSSCVVSSFPFWFSQGHAHGSRARCRQSSVWLCSLFARSFSLAFVCAGAGAGAGIMSLCVSQVTCKYHLSLRNF